MSSSRINMVAMDNVEEIKNKFERVEERLNISNAIVIPAHDNLVETFLEDKLESWLNLISELRALQSAYTSKYVEENPGEGDDSAPICPICMDPIFPSCSIATNCNHVYHSHCIMDYCRVNITVDCPLCRRYLSKHHVSSELRLSKRKHDPAEDRASSQMPPNFLHNMRGWGLARGYSEVEQLTILFSSKYRNRHCDYIRYKLSDWISDDLEVPQLFLPTPRSSGSLTSQSLFPPSVNQDEPTADTREIRTEEKDNSTAEAGNAETQSFSYVEEDLEGFMENSLLEQTSKDLLEQAMQKFQSVYDVDPYCN